MKAKISFCRNSAGARLAFAVFGDGPVLVVTPPWISSLEVQLEDPAWLGLFERLAHHHTIVAYDKLGCGLSDRDRSDFSRERDIEDTQRIIDEVGPDQFDLFGISQGGPVAIGVAARNAGRLRRLILYGSYARGRDIAPDGGAALLSLVRASWGLGSRAFATLFLPESLDDPTAMGIVLRWERAAADREVAAGLLEALFSYDVTAELGDLSVPTLVLHRRGDRAFPPTLGRNLAAAIPGSRFVLLDGDGHVPWYGDIDSVVQQVTEFLGDEPEPIVVGGPEPPQVVHLGRTVRHVDVSDTAGRPAKDRSRIGLAQMSLQMDSLEERDDGLLGLREDRVDDVLGRVRRLVNHAADQSVDLLVFPEMTLDLKVPRLRDEVQRLATDREIVLVPGSFHDPMGRRNVSTVFGPEGCLWEQEKQLPAILTVDGKQIFEAITAGSNQVIVATTRLGRIAIVICRDFLDLDIRVALRRSSPAVDIVLNPAFTPVTADFQAAHFEARRSLYSYCFFCNVAEFGGSSINSPERGRRRRALPAGVEAVRWKDVDLVGLRAERERWAEMRDRGQFIQSTR